MSFLEHGSDLVGSIRNPAAFCGVYGLKPSAGIVPATGLQPPGPPAQLPEFVTPAAIGPLARSAADLRMALGATGGMDGVAGAAFSWALPPARHRRLADFRVGVVLDDPQAPVTEEVGAALSDAVDALAKAGVTVVEGWPADVDPARSAQSFGFQIGLFFAVQDPNNDFGPLAEIVEQDRQRAANRAACSRYFADIDAFVCPANFMAAFPNDPRPIDVRTIATSDGERPYTDQPFWISHASLAGLPAVVVPIGRTARGLPVAVHLGGPQYEDHTAITFAELVADVCGGFDAPPQTRFS